MSADGPPGAGPRKTLPFHAEGFLGRQYPTYRRGAYMFPCDEREQDRLDLFHQLFLIARRDKLHSAPLLPHNPPNQHILDLGCGTGIWAIDVADADASRRVVGWDFTLYQPEQIPPGCDFTQQDIESTWPDISVDSLDLVHMRMLSGSIRLWGDLYSRVFQHLKPGCGWIEQVEIDWYPRCDDDTLPRNAAVYRWANELYDAMDGAARTLRVAENAKERLLSAGFTDVEEEVVRLPFNPWSDDMHEYELGRWFNLGLTQSLEPLSLAPLVQIKNYSLEQVNFLIQEVEKDICTKTYHGYCRLHIFTARKPENSDPRSTRFPSWTHPNQDSR